MFKFLTAACAAVSFAVCAQAQDSPLRLGVGLHYSSGDYGTGTDTHITTLDATARYERGPWVYKATVPWIEVSGSSAVIPGVGRTRGSAGTRTESGLGDIVLSGTYAAYYDPASTLGLDLTGKVKLATADESRGLGTGEHDLALLVDLYRSFDRVTGFGGIGHHILGDSAALPLQNAWSANLGASYRLDGRDTVGAILEGRERALPGGARQRDLMGFWLRNLDRAWRAQAYLLIGLADGSPDWGMGLSLTRPL